MLCYVCIFRNVRARDAVELNIYSSIFRVVAAFYISRLRFDENSHLIFVRVYALLETEITTLHFAGDLQNMQDF